ncbi:MAG: hypothetical protein CMM01_12425 [Rhodopirellula sp.]|nr:hypothetical protein [Rhodopirellula sp.]OUX51018.1 MAG: hypothetical protein CBE43_05175 [Rhodopirellula sp. TMED283]
MASVLIDRLNGFTGHLFFLQGVRVLLPSSLPQNPTRRVRKLWESESDPTLETGVICPLVM